MRAAGKFLCRGSYRISANRRSEPRPAARQEVTATTDYQCQAQGEPSDPHDCRGNATEQTKPDKLDHIRNSNPSMKLVIYDKKKLEDLNIDYVSVQKELL